MANKNIRKEKKKKKEAKPLKRKLHIDGEEWSYFAQGCNVKIQRPSGEQFCVNQSELTGVSWDELERAKHKGYSQQYSMTPGRIKSYIEIAMPFRRHLNKHPLYEPEHYLFVHKTDDGYCIIYRPVRIGNMRREETYVSINIVGSIFYLLHIELKEVHRGKGHGDLLYRLFEDVAKELKCTQIRQTPSGQTPGGETRKDYLLRRNWIDDGEEVYKDLKNE